MELKCSLSGQISFMSLPVSFPRAEAEVQRARPGLWGRRACARECVRAPARDSVGVRGSTQLQQKPFGKRTSSCQPPHLALVIVGGGEGRSKKCVCVCVCVRAPVCALGGAWTWWGQLGNSSMLIKTPPTSWPNPLPLCCLSESETSKGRIPVKLPMLGHPYL